MAATRQATQALSSRWRERTKPLVISRRGSKAMKSPTRIPSACVSSWRGGAGIQAHFHVVIITLGLIHLAAKDVPGCHFEAGSSHAPAHPVLAKTMQPSPSTVFQAKPPILVIIKRPLGLICFTMAPSVSAWAVRARGASEFSPCQLATRAPLRVRCTANVRKSDERLLQ